MTDKTPDAYARREKPSPSEFARAEFARTTGHRAAVRMGWTDSPYAWKVVDMPDDEGWLSDDDMSDLGWFPARECPDPGQHKVASVALEHPAMEGVGESPLPLFEAVNSRLNELAKAERERDEAVFREERAHENVRAREEMINRLDARARQAESRAAILGADPRLLTPDAIADEMVERAAHCMAMQQMPTTYSLEPDGTADKFYDDAREVLDAALTEPPARPEGARDIEVLLFDVGVDENRAEVANYLAARLNVSPKENR